MIVNLISKTYIHFIILLNYPEKEKKMSNAVDKLWTKLTTYTMIKTLNNKLKLIQSTHWNYDVMIVKILKHLRTGTCFMHWSSLLSNTRYTTLAATY